MYVSSLLLSSENICGTGAFNETRTHSFIQYKWPLVGQVGLYRGSCSSFLECVYFALLYPSLIFDMFIVVCVSVCVSVCVGVGVVLGFTNSFLFVCVCVCVGVCIFGNFVVLNLQAIISPFLYMYTYVCVCVCFQLFSFV